MLQLTVVALGWAPTGMHCPRVAPRVRTALLAATVEAAEEVPATSATSEAPAEVKVSVNSVLNGKICQARDSEDVLKLVDENYETLNAVNAATALHRIAARNKKARARRDVLERDQRFQKLVDAIRDKASDDDVSARSVADALWSFATLDHFPATLLVPILTSVSVQLEREAFAANHLSTVVWALARLQCKPVKLLERIEQQAIAEMGDMDMQNVANMLWGCAKLQYQPAALLPKLSAALVEAGFLADAKPVEVADLAFALEKLENSRHEPLLLAMAARAAPDAALGEFSSRQLVTLISAFTALEATDVLPDGLLDEWVGAVRTAHRTRPLLAVDARRLEACLAQLGIDGGWIKSTEMLAAWAEKSKGGDGRAQRYTDEELEKVFASIDTDGSGDIDQTELTAAIKAINPEVDDETVQGMLKLADADGNATVDLDEFKLLMRGNMGGAAAAAAAGKEDGA